MNSDYSYYSDFQELKADFRGAYIVPYELDIDYLERYKEYINDLTFTKADTTRIIEAVDEQISKLKHRLKTNQEYLLKANQLSNTDENKAIEQLKIANQLLDW